MLIGIKQLDGVKLGASDGDIGHIRDFYFSDENWTIRYLVLDTGDWLPGRSVLISPHAIGRLLPAGKTLPAKLSRKQVENSPTIDLHKPVCRQYEEDYHRYYGWPPYWDGGGLWGVTGAPIPESLPANAPMPARPVPASASERRDSHLRSTSAVNGYHVLTPDGNVGHVTNFMVDPQTWQILQLSVKTGHRLSGQEVLLPTSQVSRISYEDSTVFMNAAAGEATKPALRTPVPAAMDEPRPLPALPAIVL